MNFSFKKILCIFSLVFLYDLKSNDSDFELYINNHNDHINFFLYIKKEKASKKDTLKEFIKNNEANLKKEFYNKIEHMNEKYIISQVYSDSLNQNAYVKDGYYKYEFEAILEDHLILKYKNKLYEYLKNTIYNYNSWQNIFSSNKIEIDIEDSPTSIYKNPGYNQNEKQNSNYPANDIIPRWGR